MSGEATVTPGKVWGNELVDKDKLNLAAVPTVRIDEDSIAARELDETDFLAAYADSFREKNFFFNPVMWGRYWQDITAAGLSCPAAEHTENASGWFAAPTGAPVEFRQLAETPENSSKSKYAAQIVGAASVTTVLLGQFLHGDIAKQLAAGNIAFSCNLRATADTLANTQAWIYSAATENQLDSIGAALQLTRGTYTYGGDSWTRLTFTGDLSGLSNLEKGFAVVLKFASGDLDTGTKTIAVTQCQLEDSAAATSFINPVNPDALRLNNFTSLAAPAVTDDITKGFRPGSFWYNVTDPLNPAVYVASNTAEAAAAWHRVVTELVQNFTVYDSKANNTAGGTYTSGAHVVRDLNVISPVSGITTYPWSLATNQITLGAGTWRVSGFVPAYRVNTNTAWLYDTTAAAIIVQGQNAEADSTAANHSLASINGFFTLTEESVLEVRQECLTTRATDGLGVAMNFGNAEIYTHLAFQKIPT